MTPSTNGTEVCSSAGHQIIPGIPDYQVSDDYQITLCGVDFESKMDVLNFRCSAKQRLPL